jgi:hypothetical protein
MSRAKEKDLEVSKYAEVYELAKAGLSDKDISEHLGLKKGTFRRMKTRVPAVGALVEAGRKSANPKWDENFEEYLYGKMSPQVRVFWDKIMKLWKAKPSQIKGAARRKAIEDVLAETKNSSKSTRQGLFIHALIKTGFNGTRASQMSGVPYRTYMNWAQHDPHFQHLLEEIDWHRKNFFESAFIKLVRKGVPSAVIHGVKTQAADRGYGTKVEINSHSTREEKISLDDLDLDPKTLKQVLKAVRAQNKALPAHNPDVIEAEVVSVRKSGKRKN